MDRVKIVPLDVKTDERGWVVELIRRENLSGEDRFGQVMLTTALPGIAKGNHFHKRKNEWFCVIKGRGELLLEDVEAREYQSIEMGDNNMLSVGVPPKVAHAIRNVGEDTLYVLVYVDEPFDSNDPDTFDWSLESGGE